MLTSCLAACTHLSSTVSQLFEPQLEKNSPFSRTAAHIFVSPGDAPGAITLNVVWMETEFHVDKLSHCMCPSNYNRFWDRARYLWKNRHFIMPSLHSTPPLRGFPSEYGQLGTPLGVEKLEWCRYPKVNKFRRYVYSFVLTWSTNVTDGRIDRQTDGQTDTAWQHRPRLRSIAR